jgi:hypothetical protein
VDRVEVQLLDHVEDEVGKVARGQPIHRRRWEQEALLRLVGSVGFCSPGVEIMALPPASMRATRVSATSS